AWINLFGDSVLSVRALSGVFAVAALPVVGWMVWRNWGKRIALISLAFMASAPYAIYYATEARPYSMVIFITAIGFLAFAEIARGGGKIWGFVLALSVAAGLYTHYWTIYLITSAVILVLARWKFQGGTRATRISLIAVLAGGLAFLPWLPTFLYQSAHTGTPWGTQPSITTVLGALSHFNEDQARLIPLNSICSHVLAAGYLLLPLVAILGLGTSRWAIEFDFRTRSEHRAIGFVLIGTLFIGILGCIASGSAFAPRYASVAFIPLVIICALATQQFRDPILRSLVIVGLVLASVYASFQYSHTKRTQAPEVAAVINGHAHPGDVLAFCPDQLGPSVMRLVTVPHLQMAVYPVGSKPAFVDWVDYLKRIEQGNATSFAARLRVLAGANHHVWLVYSGGYRKYQKNCTNTAAFLSGEGWVAQAERRYYQPMNLLEFTPPGAPLRP
ncbi:MAG: glycosyltransferase family 39 protein, partial [Actinomycetes bacterium]